MKRTPVTATIAAAALAAAALAAPAGGAGPTVSVGQVGDDARASALSLNITGSTEPDDITLALDPSQTQYVLTSNHPFDPPASPCTQSSTFEIRCPASEFAGFTAVLREGNDTFTVMPSVRAITSLAGQDGLDDLIGGGGADSLIGGIGADRLVGNKGQDKLLGGLNGDILNGGKGRDTLKGGKGNDVLRGGPGRDVEKQ